MCETFSAACLPTSSKRGTSSSAIAFEGVVLAWFGFCLTPVRLTCIHLENAENGFLFAGARAFPRGSTHLPKRAKRGV